MFFTNIKFALCVTCIELTLHITHIEFASCIYRIYLIYYIEVLSFTHGNVCNFSLSFTYMDFCHLHTWKCMYNMYKHFFTLYITCIEFLNFCRLHAWKYVLQPTDPFAYRRAYCISCCLTVVGIFDV